MTIRSWREEDTESETLEISSPKGERGAFKVHRPADLPRGASRKKVSAVEVNNKRALAGELRISHSTSIPAKEV